MAARACACCACISRASRPLRLTVLHSARRLNGTAGPAPQQSHQTSIDNDQPNQQKPPDARQFRAGKPKHKGAEHNDPNAHDQRHQLDCERRSNRQRRQQKRHNRITKQPAQPKSMSGGPLWARLQCGGIDRSERNGDGCKNQPPQRPIPAPNAGQIAAPRRSARWRYQRCPNPRS